MVIVVRSGLDDDRAAAAAAADGDSLSLSQQNVLVESSYRALNRNSRVGVHVPRTWPNCYGCGSESELRRRHRVQICYRVRTRKLQRMPRLDTSRRDYKLAHPTMDTYDKRIATFDSTSPPLLPPLPPTSRLEWRRVCQSVSKHLLAGHGFFLMEINERDEATCFACGSVFADWRPSDAPVREHVRLLPNVCPFATQLYKRLCRTRTLLHDAVSVNRAKVIVPCRARLDVWWPRKVAFQLSTPSANVYADESIRRATYSRSNELQLNPDIMARAGFVFIGSVYEWFRNREIRQHYEHDRFLSRRRDAVRCFACGYIFYNWMINACPWTEHAALSANCPYVWKK